MYFSQCQWLIVLVMVSVVVVSECGESMVRYRVIFSSLGALGVLE